TLRQTVSLEGTRVRGPRKRQLVGGECGLVAAAARAPGPEPVGQDPEAPVVEPVGFGALRKRAVGTHERILQRILGILTVAEHPQRKSLKPIPVSTAEHPLGFGIALLLAAYVHPVLAHGVQTPSAREKSRRHP